MAIRVNGTQISEAEIAREMSHHPAASMEEARRRAAEALVFRQLLLDEANRLGIEGPSGELVEDPRIGALIEREVHTPDPDEETCRRYYEQNRSRFRSSDQFEARHILLACAPDDLERRDAAKAKAVRIIAALQLDPTQFGQLAIAYSACPSRNRGGSLGLCRRGDTVSEFETYVMSLSPGELCPVPIETRYGVHVIALDRKWPGTMQPFAAVRNRVADYLRAASFHVAVRHYLLRLAGQASVEGFEIAGADSPLVQ